ncbi:hypothetical protein LTS18_006487 [Coniosporium uncinatum]|uniref:Uncharacterized protein n=1 Tax=Coniosporium uncinatum TaxID=93489 RepID=A0ACC3DQD0_9PEZI|nr:hypothetical protein LTS18_006487 [Coniosporium uncinatum]
MSRGYFPKRTELELTPLFSGLITATHILHHHSLLTTTGSISVRNPDRRETFFLADDDDDDESIAPALLSSASSLLEYFVDSGAPVEQKTAADETAGAVSERYIHSELYKKFAHVNAVVFSPCADVLPFGLVPSAAAAAAAVLRPTTAAAAFIGAEAPVWDIGGAYASSDAHALRVSTAKLGHSLALKFARPETSGRFLMDKMTSALGGGGGGGGGAGKDGAGEFPEHPVVVMRGMGFAAAGRGVEDVVYMAVKTREAAVAQMRALAVGAAYWGGTVEGKVNVEGGGVIKNGKVKREGEVRYLDAKEVKDSAELRSGEVAKAWRVWCREVEVNPLYRNDVEQESAT